MGTADGRVWHHGKNFYVNRRKEGSSELVKDKNKTQPKKNIKVVGILWFKECFYYFQLITVTEIWLLALL